MSPLMASLLAVIAGMLCVIVGGIWWISDLFKPWF